MPLLDPKHLAAPFNNTVHIVTIVAVVMLFVVYRLATGGVEFEDTTSAMRSTITHSQSIPAPRLEPNERAAPPTKAPTASTSEDPSKDLQEIERALGLSK